MIWCYSEF